MIIMCWDAFSKRSQKKTSFATAGKGDNPNYNYILYNMIIYKCNWPVVFCNPIFLRKIQLDLLRRNFAFGGFTTQSALRITLQRWKCRPAGLVRFQKISVRVQPVSSWCLSGKQPWFCAQNTTIVLFLFNSNVDRFNEFVQQKLTSTKFQKTYTSKKTVSNIYI